MHIVDCFPQVQPSVGQPIEAQIRRQQRRKRLKRAPLAPTINESVEDLGEARLGHAKTDVSWLTP
jgi:hypothetical protein